VCAPSWYQAMSATRVASWTVCFSSGACTPPRSPSGNLSTSTIIPDVIFPRFESLLSELHGTQAMDQKRYVATRPLSVSTKLGKNRKCQRWQGPPDYLIGQSEFANTKLADTFVNINDISCIFLQCFVKTRQRRMQRFQSKRWWSFKNLWTPKLKKHVGNACAAKLKNATAQPVSTSCTVAYPSSTSTSKRSLQHWKHALFVKHPRHRACRQRCLQIWHQWSR